MGRREPHEDEGACCVVLSTTLLSVVLTLEKHFDKKGWFKNRTPSERSFAYSTVHKQAQTATLVRGCRGVESGEVGVHNVEL